ncbi:MAG: alpha/beta fold hydrolase [Ferrovibrio sp.]|uniref:alpha/beta fold hydrolase n=1 Tax=Ferrovibrio sp. TaxID=1917215 RepID=UPI003918AED2
MTPFAAIAANDRSPADAGATMQIPIQAFVGPRGTLVHQFTAGDGAPVIALHCSGGQGVMWRGMLPWLGDTFRLHCPDLYGYGRSEPFPAGNRMTLDDEAELVGALLRRFDRPVHLIGHSYGGAVALRTAIDHATRLCSLTLYEPVAFHLLRPELGGHAPALHQIQILAADMRTAYLRDDATTAARLFIDYWNEPGSFDRMTLQRQAALIVQVPRLWLDFVLTLGCKTMPASYRSLKLPVLLLSGMRSPGTVRLIADRLAGLLPAVRHAILPDLGHMAPVSHPDAVARVMLPFLRACETSHQQRACA